MYTATEQQALSNLFDPVEPNFKISRPAMSKLAAQKLEELREDYPNKELYWIALEDDLTELLESPSVH